MQLAAHSGRPIYEVGMMQHSTLGASSAKRWMTCPGSVRMHVPQPSTVHAEEGTTAHWLGEVSLRHYAANGVPPTWSHFDGNMCPETSMTISRDMIGYVKGYFQYVAELAGAGNHARVLVEQRFDLSWIYPGMFGTSDASVYDPVRKHLDVIDLKYGQGVAVDAQDNPQGAFYAIGAAAPYWHEVETIAFHIYQPRISSEPSVWQFTRAELHAWADRFKRAAERASQPDAPLVYEDEACRWCSARQTDPATGKPYCSAYYEAQRKAVEYVAEPRPGVGTLTPEELAEELNRFSEAKSLIENRLTALKLWSTDLADKMGRDIPGYKLVSRRATRKWRDTDELVAVLRLCYGLGDEQIFKSEVLSPAQLENLRDSEGNKIVASDVVLSYTEKADNGVELVPVSDKRAAIAPRKLVMPALPDGLKPFVTGE